MPQSERCHRGSHRRFRRRADAPPLVGADADLLTMWPPWTCKHARRRYHEALQSAVSVIHVRLMQQRHTASALASGSTAMLTALVHGNIELQHQLRATCKHVHGSLHCKSGASSDSLFRHVRHVAPLNHFEASPLRSAGPRGRGPLPLPAPCMHSMQQALLLVLS